MPGAPKILQRTPKKYEEKTSSVRKIFYKSSRGGATAKRVGGDAKWTPARRRATVFKASKISSLAGVIALYKRSSI